MGEPTVLDSIIEGVKADVAARDDIHEEYQKVVYRNVNEGMEYVHGCAG